MHTQAGPVLPIGAGGAVAVLQQILEADGTNDAILMIGHAFPAIKAMTYRAAGGGFTPAVIKAAMLDLFIHQ